MEPPGARLTRRRRVQRPLIQEEQATSARWSAAGAAQALVRREWMRIRNLARPLPQAAVLAEAEPLLRPVNTGSNGVSPGRSLFALASIVSRHIGWSWHRGPCGPSSKSPHEASGCVDISAFGTVAIRRYTVPAIITTCWYQARWARLQPSLFSTGGPRTLRRRGHGRRGQPRNQPQCSRLNCGSRYRGCGRQASCSTASIS